ncbi:Protein O-linked-mannose beta-1,4-N-acetylglucosaminyltransferase 2, partial [Ananas comosus]
MDGDVRIHGNFSSIYFINSIESDTSVTNETWQVKPYTRKHDRNLMERIRELTIASSHSPFDAPTCTVNHSIPAVVFATEGITGNFYHAFTDLLIPLFITSRQFDGEVQFLISQMLIRWVHKYERILKKLSNYEVIDLDKEVKVHCYPHAIVGLHSHKPLSIEPSRAPNNYSMVDFAKFMRTAYALDRDSSISLRENPRTNKPRLLIIARNRTRQLVNIDEVARMADGLGFEVVLEEGSSLRTVGQFAQIVNSCDVMMGVHGAGLTNSIFLPTNGVLIQVVPFGMLEAASMVDFGIPAGDMKLKYLQYSISEEESTLIELYPRDHPVLRDPKSLHKQGWSVLSKIYLRQQNVRLNVTRSEDSTLEKKPMMCDFSNSRTDICEIEGDVRISGKNSSIFSVSSPETDGPYENETWRIKPYPRKADKQAMSNVKELTLKSLSSFKEAPQCTDRYDVPAVVFSVHGFTGNYFHAFTDVFVPLFETAHGFNGEVRFVITDFRARWIHRFLPIFKSLSRYDMIDLDNNDGVLCFPRAIVGLKSHNELSIDASPSPKGYSMVDFLRFMRGAYSLKRDSVAAVGIRRPRLLIISRERTRKLVNVKDVIRLAEKLGYQVVVPRAQKDLAQFSRVVNSCDVMMGVHGAGLTNIVFLPTNAVLIQIVPWGGLDWVVRTCFGEPSKEMKLQYLEYSISEEESTLIEQYPRDHAVFTDPASIRKRGWVPMKEVFLDKQDVNLNLSRFKPVLEKALELLHT